MAKKVPRPPRIPSRKPAAPQRAAAKSKSVHGKRRPTPQESSRREKLVAMCRSLPEVLCKPFGEDHLGFAVGKKTFGYYLFHHHGDGIVAFCGKAARGVQQRLVTSEPSRYCVPAYLGPSGWVSIRLDTPEIDWGDVLERVVEAYRLQAPKRLAEQME